MPGDPGGIGPSDPPGGFGDNFGGGGTGGGGGYNFGNCFGLDMMKAGLGTGNPGGFSVLTQVKTYNYTIRGWKKGPSGQSTMVSEIKMAFLPTDIKGGLSGIVVGTNNTTSNGNHTGAFDVSTDSYTAAAKGNINNMETQYGTDNVTVEATEETHSVDHSKEGIDKFDSTDIKDVDVKDTPAGGAKGKPTDSDSASPCNTFSAAISACYDTSGDDCDNMVLKMGMLDAGKGQEKVATPDSDFVKGASSACSPPGAEGTLMPLKGMLWTDPSPMLKQTMMQMQQMQQQGVGQ